MKDQAYRINWKIAAVLLCIGIVPALVYFIGMGIAQLLAQQSNVETPEFDQLEALFAQEKKISFEVGSQEEPFIPNFEGIDPALQMERAMARKEPCTVQGQLYQVLKGFDHYFESGAFPIRLQGAYGENLCKGSREEKMRIFAKWAGMSMDEAFRVDENPYSNPVAVLQALIHILAQQHHFLDETEQVLRATNERILSNPEASFEISYSAENEHIQLLPKEGKTCRFKMFWNLSLKGGFRKTFYAMESLVEITSQ